MFRFLSCDPYRTRLLLFAAGIFCSLSSWAGLSYQEALHIALQETPLIKAREADITAAQQAVIPAGELPDPKLTLGINNLPIEGADRFDPGAEPMTMKQVGVMQEFPNRAKRKARIEVAQSKLSVKENEYQRDQIVLLRATAIAWLLRHNLEQQSQLLDELDKENQLLTRAIEARHAAEHAAATDTLVPRQEAAMLEEQRDQLARRLTRAQAELRLWLGVNANQPLSGIKPDWTLTLEALLNNLQQNPELTIYDPMARLADAEIAEARADKRPDWGLEVSYAQREQQFGDMVSVRFSMDLPLFGSRRQGPALAAKLAEREQLSAEREYKSRSLTAALESDYADYLQITRALERQREVLVPLANKKVALVTAAWKGNQVPLTDVINARREYIEAQLKQLDLVGQSDQAAAYLHYTYGLTGGSLAVLTARGRAETKEEEITRKEITKKETTEKEITKRETTPGEASYE